MKVNGKNIRSMPSELKGAGRRVYPTGIELATLAAMMNKGAREAFLLWNECDVLMFDLRHADPDTAVRIIGRIQAGETNLCDAVVGKYLPLDEAMSRIGVHAEKTLWKIYSAFLEDNPERSPFNDEFFRDKNLTDEDKKAIARAGWRKSGLEEDLVAMLTEYHREQNAQRGRRNRTAGNNSKGKRPVK